MSLTFQEMEWDSPYRYAIEHWKRLAEPNLSFLVGLQHFFYALFEFILPFLNYLIVLFDPLQLNIGANKLAQSKAIPEDPIEFPKDQEVLVPDPPAATASIKERVIYSQAVRKKAQYKNLFFNANATGNTNGYLYLNFDVFTHKAMREIPLVKAVYTNNLQKVAEIISSPFYRGINAAYFYKKPGENEKFDPYNTLSLLTHAIVNKITPLFDLVFEEGRGVHYTQDAFIQAIKLGKDGEYYLNKMLLKNSVPPDDAMITLAISNNIESGLIKCLQDRKLLHERGANSQNALQNACEELNVEEATKLIEKANFYLGDIFRFVVDEYKNKSDQQKQQQIIKVLMNNGAPCDAQSLLKVVLWQNASWEEFAMEMIERGANPFDSNHQCIETLLVRIKMDHPIMKKIEALYPGSIQHYINSLNLATVWGIKFKEMGGEFTGGNFTRNTYPILKQTFEQFRKGGTSHSLPTLITDQLEQSITYANEFIQAVSFVGVADAIRKNSKLFPVIIPTSASRHASCIIFWQNTIIQANRGASHSPIKGVSGNPGINIYAYDEYQLKDVHIEGIFNPFALDSNAMVAHFKNSCLIESFAKTVDGSCQLINHLDTPEQEVGNCTWSSSALLGFQVAMEVVNTANDSLSSMEFTEENNDLTEYFNILAKLVAVENYLKNIQNHQEDTCDSISKDGISAVFRACLIALVDPDVKHKELYDEIIDMILNSGLPIDCRSGQLEKDINTIKEKKSAEDKALILQKVIIKATSMMDLARIEDVVALLDPPSWHLSPG